MSQMVVFFKGVGGGALIKALPASNPKSGKDDDEGTGQPGDCGEECEYGPHNVKPGHHIAFEAGAFHGAGKVASSGEDGAVVSDHSGREHRIHWHEVKGHFEKDTGQDGGASGGKATPLKKARVSGYTRKDGAFVAEHEDSRPSAQNNAKATATARAALYDGNSSAMGSHKVGDTVSFKDDYGVSRSGVVKGDRDGKVVVQHKAGYTSTVHHSKLTAASGGTSLAALKKHPMYTDSDYAYFKNKGYNHDEIKSLWDRDHQSGVAPVNHEKAPDVVGVASNPDFYKKNRG